MSEPTRQDLGRFVRANDPDTSLRAAIKAAKASTVATQMVWRVMLDGAERIDEEIWDTCRKIGYVVSLSTIQHGRLALSTSGHLRDCGTTRATTDGCESVVWATTANTNGLVVPELLANPGPASKRRASKAFSPENSPVVRLASVAFRSAGLHYVFTDGETVFAGPLHTFKQRPFFRGVEVPIVATSALQPWRSRSCTLMLMSGDGRLLFAVFSDLVVQGGVWVLPIVEAA